MQTDFCHVKNFFLNFAENRMTVWHTVAKLWFRKLCVIFSNALYISVYPRDEFNPSGMEGGRLADHWLSRAR